MTDDDFEACRSAVVRYAAQVPTGSLVRRVATYPAAGGLWQQRSRAPPRLVLAASARFWRSIARTRGRKLRRCARLSTPEVGTTLQVGVLQFSAHVVVEVPFAGTVVDAAEDGADSDGDGGSEEEEEEEEGAAARPRVAAVAPPFDLDAFSTAVSAIQRINGATYISIALRCVLAQKKRSIMLVTQMLTALLRLRLQQSGGHVLCAGVQRRAPLRGAAD